MMTADPVARVAPAPNWFDSLMFLALMSGPPKFRDRDPFASLAGTIDAIVVFQIVVWACGALWVLMRLYPDVLRRGVVPSVNAAQAVAALFIASLTLSLWQSPGFLLTAYTLGQFAVMLSFVWVFTQRFGPAACLRHMFMVVAILALTTIVLVVVAPEVVTDGTDFVTGVSRVRGDNIADTGSLAVIGLVLCLSSLPALRGPMFWGTLAMFGGLLVGSRTRSAYVAFLVFLPFGFVYGKRLRVRQLIVPLAALAFSAIVMDALSSTVDYLVRERDSIGTMSDRIPLWQHLTDVVMRESPIIGMGYYAASRIAATDYNPVLGNAHSAFFEVLIGGGILGAALYVLLCGCLIWYSVRLLRVASGEPGAVAAVGLLLVALVTGVSTPAALQAGPLGFAFWSLTAILPRLCRDAAPAWMAGEQRPHARQFSQPAVADRRLAVMSRQAR